MPRAKSSFARFFLCGLPNLRQDSRDSHTFRDTGTAAVKALARAFRWRRLQDEEEHATFDELAKAEGVSQSYVSRVRLKLLAPAIVEAILDGRQPEGMRLENVLERY
jgi:hypothetical protein